MCLLFAARVWRVDVMLRCWVQSSKSVSQQGQKSSFLESCFQMYRYTLICFQSCNMSPLFNEFCRKKQVHIVIVTSWNSSVVRKNIPGTFLRYFFGNWCSILLGQRGETPITNLPTCFIALDTIKRRNRKTERFFALRSHRKFTMVILVCSRTRA